MERPHFVYPSHFALMNRASRDTGADGFVWTQVFISLWINEGAEPLDHMATLQFEELLFYTLVAEFTRATLSVVSSPYSHQYLVAIKNAFPFKPL